jgi:hypothetical protein
MQYETHHQVHLINNYLTKEPDKSKFNLTNLLQTAEVDFNSLQHKQLVDELGSCL